MTHTFADTVHASIVSVRFLCILFLLCFQGLDFWSPLSEVALTVFLPPL